MSLSEPEFDWVFHVGVTLPNTAISPLSLWERARVRGLLIWFLIWLWLLIFSPFGRPSVGVHQGVRRAAPCGEAAYIERRCSEANRRRCPLMGTVAREH